MALVRMRASISGARNGKPWPKPGGTIELPDAEADDMIRNGYAVAVQQPVEAATAVEAALAPAAAVETATVKRTPRKRSATRTAANQRK